MGLFSKKESYLGIDFDAQSIKVVECANEKNRARLVTYGYYDKTIDRIKNETLDAKETAKILKAVCKKAKTQSVNAVSSLPAFSVFSSLLTLPSMSKKELGSAVEWEAKKIIPLPLEDMILDWKVLAEQGAGTASEQSTDRAKATISSESLQDKKINTSESQNTIKVLLTAAPKDLVKKYIDIFKEAGLNLLSLDTESFALIRSLVGNDKSSVMIVDIGSVVTTITIVANGIPLLNRSIDVGGLTITRAIADSLNINLQRAEQFKFDIGVAQNSTGRGAVPQTIQAALQPVVDEIRFSLNIYKNQGNKGIEKIILTGGSSLLLQLPEHLSTTLDLKVYRGDAWARVIYPEQLRPVLDEVGPRFSTAIGLAMRNIV